MPMGIDCDQSPCLWIRLRITESPSQLSMLWINAYHTYPNNRKTFVPGVARFSCFENLHSQVELLFFTATCKTVWYRTSCGGFRHGLLHYNWFANSLAVRCDTPNPSCNPPFLSCSPAISINCTQSHVAPLTLAIMISVY